jgi:hypothetical protein
MPERPALQEQLAAQLTAVGLGAESERSADLLTAYQSPLAGVDRIAVLERMSINSGCASVRRATARTCAPASP